jgi:hypothetical protein
VRVVDVGVQPVGVIAIGANATGIVAVGQLATGVVAIGQLARGAIVVGQLSLGLVAVGQLSLGVAWSAGLGAGGTSGPGLVFGAFGRLYLQRLRGRRSGPALEQRGWTRGRAVAAFVTVAALTALWWFAAGVWLVDALTRTGGILVDPPHVLK